jgi:hypothetical protein
LKCSGEFFSDPKKILVLFIQAERFLVRARVSVLKGPQQFPGRDNRFVSVVEEIHCPKWKTAASFAAEVIKVYSTDFGMYQYPKMVVADANDGMEYPMITFDGGSEPYFKGLFAHEIAHNWFYGMVGSNETYRAMMDEGFTQFLTVWSLVKIAGDIDQP